MKTEVHYNNYSPILSHEQGSDHDCEQTGQWFYCSVSREGCGWNDKQGLEKALEWLQKEFGIMWSVT